MSEGEGEVTLESEKMNSVNRKCWEQGEQSWKLWQEEENGRVSWVKRVQP